MPVYEAGSAPSPGFTPAYGAPHEGPSYYDSKSPYEGDRFKPKKRINDPVFLILFVLQVCLHCG